MLLSIQPFKLELKWHPCYPSFSPLIGHSFEKYSILTSVKLPSLPLYYTFAALHFLICKILLLHGTMTTPFPLPHPFLPLTGFHHLHHVHSFFGLLSTLLKSVFLTFDQSAAPPCAAVLSMIFRVPSISDCDCWQCVMIISRGIHTLYFSSYKNWYHYDFPWKLKSI